MSDTDVNERMRVVHFTDIHVQPERGAPESLKRAIERVRSFGPEAVLLGGDFVMNSVGVNLERVQQQWDLWHEAIRELEMPTFACIGNQDCWGWNLKASGCTGLEPLFGKAMALKQLGLDRPYYAADLGAWRLVVLDSIHQGGRHGFVSELDPPQRAWLQAELADSGQKPVLIMSHVPFVAGPADLFSSHILEPVEAGYWPLPAQHLHRDSFDVIQLLRRFPNVKLCVSGHIHVAQRMEFAGIAFIGSPPVCGEWWRGDLLGCKPGFTVVDLHPDGSFEAEFAGY